ncbi:hypothetical protein PAS25_21820 [Leclercia adecarboxylata]|uniref:phage head spike fiber domain-containing protein n=1 Tax=Leclercia adecarboxylata TaxID=83655 RepID=UPI003134204F
MSAGTIKLTNGSTAVVGTGTAFTSDLKTGDVITATVGGVFFTLFVNAVASNTALTLTDPFTGPTTSGLAWVAVPQLTLNRITAALAAQTAESVRRVLQENANWQAFYTGTGDITVTLPDGSPAGRPIAGPSWKKITDLINASDLSAIQLLASATQANATQAAADALSASASKSAAKTSETNAKTSETNAAASASSAAASLAAAQLLTSVPYEAAPYPDVWVPFNDSLKMEGIAPYDTLTISGKMVEISSKSATFTRSTVATYIDKSGIMRNADINEPRFEKEGLLIEPQITNLYSYSEQWGAGSRVTTTNNSANSPRGDKTMALVIEDSAGAEHYTQDRNIVLTAGTTYCFSVFVKAHTSPRNLYLRVASGSTSQSFFNPATGAWSGNAGGADYVDRGFEDIGNGVYRVWMAFTAAASQSTVIRLQLANGVTASYTGDGNSGLYVWGAQLEDSSFPTSYIPTAESTVTRGVDLWQIPKENCGYPSLASLFNRTLAFEFSPKYLQSAAGYVEVVKVQGPSNDIICRWVNDNTIKSYRDGGGISVPCPQGGNGVFVHTTEGNKISSYYSGATNSKTSPPNGTTQGVSYIGNINQSLSVRFVYHIRNFRIWHRLLTPNKINGLR